MTLFSEPKFIIGLVVIAVFMVGVWQYIKWRDRREEARKLAAIKERREQAKASPEALQEAENILFNQQIDHYADPEATIPVRMPDSITGDVYDNKISETTALAIIKECGGLGRRWMRNGKPVFGINRYWKPTRAEDGTVTTVEGLRPIPVPTGIKHDPHDLYRDLNQEEVELLVRELAKGEEKSLSEQIWANLPWIAAIGFIIFLVASN